MKFHKWIQALICLKDHLKPCKQFWRTKKYVSTFELSPHPHFLAQVCLCTFLHNPLGLVMPSFKYTVNGMKKVACKYSCQLPAMVGNRKTGDWKKRGAGGVQEAGDEGVGNGIPKGARSRRKGGKLGNIVQ